jgi:hypothetical protein
MRLTERRTKRRSILLDARALGGGEPVSRDDRSGPFDLHDAFRRSSCVLVLSKPKAPRGREREESSLEKTNVHQLGNWGNWELGNWEAQFCGLAHGVR